MRIKERKERKYRKTSRKSTSRHGYRKTKSKRHTNRQRYIRGGNYEKDITTQIYQGVAMKPSNKVVTSVPGRGVMSVSAYKQLMEDEDRNGFDFYK
jgi:hypothetical protein